MDCFWTQLEDNLVTTWRQHLDNLERTWGQLWENFWNVLAFLDAGEEDNIILWSCSRTKLQFVSPSLNWTIGKSNHCKPRIVQTAQSKLKNKCPFEALHINFTWELYAQTSFDHQLGTTRRLQKNTLLEFIENKPICYLRVSLDQLDHCRSYLVLDNLDRFVEHPLIVGAKSSTIIMVFLLNFHRNRTQFLEIMRFCEQSCPKLFSLLFFPSKYLLNQMQT